MHKKQKLTAVEERIHYAVIVGDFNMLRKLMKSRQKFDINSKDMISEGTTALHKASGIGNLDVVKFLIESGAQVDAKDSSGYVHISAFPIKIQKTT